MGEAGERDCQKDCYKGGTYFEVYVSESLATSGEAVTPQLVGSLQVAQCLSRSRVG